MAHCLYCGSASETQERRRRVASYPPTYAGVGNSCVRLRAVHSCSPPEDEDAIGGSRFLASRQHMQTDENVTRAAFGGGKVSVLPPARSARYESRLSWICGVQSKMFAYGSDDAKHRGPPGERRSQLVHACIIQSECFPFSEIGTYYWRRPSVQLTCIAASSCLAKRQGDDRNPMCDHCKRLFEQAEAAERLFLGQPSQGVWIELATRQRLNPENECTVEHD